MATDFSYGGNTIVTSGAIRPSTKNTPTDARCRVATKADIENIPLPAVGLMVYVEDEAKFYVIKGLKANAMGVEGMQVDMAQVVEFTGGGSGSGGSGDLSDYYNKTEIDDKIKTKTVILTSSSFTDADGDGIYEANVKHDLNSNDVIVTMLDANKVALLEVYQIVDANNIKVYNDKAETITVTVRVLK